MVLSFRYPKVDHYDECFAIQAERRCVQRTSIIARADRMRICLDFLRKINEYLYKNDFPSSCEHMYVLRSKSYLT